MCCLEDSDASLPVEPHAKLKADSEHSKRTLIVCSDLLRLTAVVGRMLRQRTAVCRLCMQP